MQIFHTVKLTDLQFWALNTSLFCSFPSLSFKIYIETESKLKEHDEDYAMNSESYLEVSLMAS